MNQESIGIKLEIKNQLVFYTQTHSKSQLTNEIRCNSPLCDRCFLTC